MRLIRYGTIFLLGLASIPVSAQNEIPEDVKALLNKHMCTTCHSVEKDPDNSLIGPTYTELAARGHSVKETIKLIYKPRPSNWPEYPPMAPMPHIPQDEVKAIARWIVSLEE
jgi:cytochrome c